MGKVNYQNKYQDFAVGGFNLGFGLYNECGGIVGTLFGFLAPL